MTPKYTLLALLLLTATASFAATFTVTSKAEQGAGTFAEAIQMAAANGTSETDYVVFSLTGTSEDDRTINLTQALPDVTSNVEIDGTTQPGAVFGVSDARVRLRWNSNAATRAGFLNFGKAENIKIFGLMFYQPQWNAAGSVTTSAIHFAECYHITIGAPGKGNYMAGVAYGINTYFYNQYGQIDDTYGYSSDITIQSNIMGLDPAGGHQQFYNSEFYYYLGTGINLFKTKDVLVGGEGAGEGNCIFAYNALTNGSGADNGNGFLKIVNNKINVDITGTISNGGASSTAFTYITIRGLNLYTWTSDVQVLIKGNIMVGAIHLSDLTSYFTIQSNKLFSTNWGGQGEVLISLESCHGIVGGQTEADGNEIFAQSYYINTYAAKQEAIDGFKVAAEIRHNHIHCNRQEGNPVFPGSESGSYYQDANYPWIVTDVLKPGYVEGRACSGCRVDVYQDDDCPACEGILMLGTVTAGADGKWSFSGSFTGSVVAMATYNGVSTGGFSAPWVNDNGMKIVQPDCHLNNGSIKGVKLEGADRYQWKKITVVPGVGEQATFITSDHLDLDNLAPGTYELSPGFGSTCNGVSRRYVLSDQTFLINDSYKYITQPMCGQNNGIIEGLTVAAPNYSYHDYKSLEWKEINTNKVVGTSVYIDQLFPGTYKLYVTNNGGCIDSSDAYMLVNQSGPSLTTTSTLLTNETCGAANGSITGIMVSGASGISSYQWEDNSGKPVGTALDLTNVAAGSYRLIYKDGSSCGTITTDYFALANDGAIAVDESRKQVKASSCTVADGGITGLVVSGGDTYQWMDVNSSKAIAGGRQIDLLNVAAGTYQLTISNRFGCKQTTAATEIKQSNFASPGLSSRAYSDASCDAASGYVHPQFSQAITGYTFEWIDSISKTTISRSVNADNLPASQYYLMVTDPNRCREKMLSQVIIQLGKPAIDESGLQVTDDVCHTTTGSINNLQVSGGRKDYRWDWYTSPGEDLNRHTPQLSLLPEGMYYATVTDKDGCSVTGSVITVSNNSIDMPVPVLSAAAVSVGRTAIIQIENPNAGTYELYHHPQDATPVSTTTGNTVTTPAITGDDTWYIRNVNGDCISDFAKVDIAVIRKTRLAIPTAFSPNNDGVNDYWYIGWQGTVTHFKLAVYTRYGKQVYTSNDIYKGWDGKVNGLPLNTGSYVYVISLTDNDGKPQQVTGMVTLVY